MSDARLPPGLRRRSDAETVLEDLLPHRGTSVKDRSEILSCLCRFAAEQASARPDGRRILDFQDPRSPESEALWRRLCAAHRRPRSPGPGLLPVRRPPGGQVAAVGRLERRRLRSVPYAGDRATATLPRLSPWESYR